MKSWWLGLVLVLAPFAAAWGGDLTVVVNQARGDAGLLLLALYDRAEGFAKDGAKAKEVKKSGIQRGQVSFTFANLAPGRYALSAHHDEDGDGTLRTNWLGIPQEGVAASGEPGHLGPPRFEDCAFEMPDRDHSLTLQLHYF